MSQNNFGKISNSILFLEKTFLILENPQYKDIITWSEDGTFFKIINSQIFSTQILSKYFKHKKIQSFVRQLNIYGFKKIKKQISQNSFKHPNFCKAQPNLIRLIKRKVKSKKSEMDNVLFNNDQNQEAELKNCFENIVPVIQSKQDFKQNMATEAQKQGSIFDSLEQQSSQFLFQCHFNSNKSFELDIYFQNRSLF